MTPLPENFGMDVKGVVLLTTFLQKQINKSDQNGSQASIFLYL